MQLICKNYRCRKIILRKKFMEHGHRIWILVAVRACLKICDRNHNTNIFKPCNSSVLQIAEQILGERLQRDESLPHLLCRPCVRRFKNLIEFKNVIAESQQTLAAECRSKRCKEASPSSMPAAKTSKRESASRRQLLLPTHP